MAEQFNDDEEWHPGVQRLPWKGILKAAVVITLSVVGAFLVNHFYGDVWALLAGISLVVLASLAISYRRKKQMKTRRVYSLYKCNACNLKEVHEFKEGEYVFKRVGPCWKCDEGTIEISRVYAVKLDAEDNIRLSEPKRTTS